MLIWSILLVVVVFCHMSQGQRPQNNNTDPTSKQKTINLSEAVVCDCGFEDENHNLWTDVWYADYGLYKSSLQYDPHYLVMDYTVGAKHKDTLARVFSPSNVKLTHEGGITLSVKQNGDGKYTSAAIGTKRYKKKLPKSVSYQQLTRICYSKKRLFVRHLPCSYEDQQCTWYCSCLLLLPQ